MSLFYYWKIFVFNLEDFFIFAIIAWSGECRLCICVDRHSGFSGGTGGGISPLPSPPPLPIITGEEGRLSPKRGRGGGISLSKFSLDRARPVLAG